MELLVHRMMDCPYPTCSVSLLPPDGKVACTYHSNSLGSRLSLQEHWTWSRETLVQVQDWLFLFEFVSSSVKLGFIHQTINIYGVLLCGSPMAEC